MWKCRERYIDRIWERERGKTETKREREGEAVWECRGAWEWARWRAECLLLPTALDSPKALSQLPVPISLCTGLHPKHVWVYLSAYTVYMHLLWTPCKSRNVRVCLGACMRVCHRVRWGARQWISAGKIERLTERPAWCGGGGEQPE